MNRAGLFKKFIPILIVSAVSCAYCKSCSGPFIFDDSSNIVENPYIRELLPASNWFKTPPASNVAARPLVNLTLALNYYFGGLNPYPYHVLNLLIHILSSLILFGLVRRTLLAGTLKEAYWEHATFLSFSISLLWALHPLQTQSVTYIIQRAESLMGLMYLLVLYCANRAFSSKKPFVWQLSSVLFCVLGMLAKPVMATAPIALLLYERAFMFTSWKEAWKRNSKFYCFIFISWIILLIVLVSAPNGVEATAGFSLTKLTPMQYALTQPGVVVHYLRLAFCPNPLILDYDWPVASRAVEIIPPFLIILFLVVGSVLAWRREPRIGFLGFWFFLLLLPTSSFIPIADVAFEHRMYLALISPAALTVLGCGAFLEKKLPEYKNILGILLLVSFSFALGYLTFERNLDYSSEFRIWQDTLLKQPRNPRANNNFGMELAKRGEINEAIPYFRKALELNPYYVPAYSNLGAALAKSGDIDQAINFYEKAIKLSPTDTKARYNLGVAYKRQGKLNQALEEFQQCRRINKFETAPMVEAGLALASLSRFSESEHTLREAITLDSRNPSAFSALGYVLALQGRTSEAVPYLENAVKLDPSDKTALENLKNVREFIQK